MTIEKHKILKWAPLELKNRCIRAGAKMAEQEVTAVLSNMSVVKMPEDYAQYIEKFGVYTSTNRTELCICSFSRYVITWLYIEIRQHEYPSGISTGY